MDDQALIVVALVAVAGFVAWGASQNPIQAYGGLQGRVEDTKYEEFVRTFQDFQKRVEGNLSGPPGLDQSLVGRIRGFREEVRQFSLTVDDQTAPDIIERLERISAQTGEWLDRQANIEAQQRELVRQMKGAPHSGNAVRNPLRKPINTTNDKFSTPGPFDQPSSGMAPRTQAQNPTVDPSTGRFYNTAADNLQQGMGGFLQGNNVGSGFPAGGVGSGTKLNFGTTTFMQVDQRPNLLTDIAEHEVETGVVKPLAIKANPEAWAAADFPSRSPSQSPVPVFGGFGAQAGGMESIYGEIDWSAADPAVKQERPPAMPTLESTGVQPTEMALVSFNQQGSFDAGTEEERMRQMREESKQFARQGDMAEASKLERAADTQEFGTATVPKEKSPTKRSSAFDTLDREYMAKLAGFSEDVAVTKDPEHLKTYITSMEQLIPRRFRGKPQLWLAPAKGSTVLSSPEYRELVRVRKLAQSKLGGAGRPRSESFQATAPRQKKGRTVTDLI